MMFLEGYIAAPPTITVFSWALTGATNVAVMARAPKATAESRAIRLDMESLPNDVCSSRASAAGLRGQRQRTVRLTSSSLARATGGFASAFQRKCFWNSETFFTPERALICHLPVIANRSGRDQSVSSRRPHEPRFQAGRQNFLDAEPLRRSLSMLAITAMTAP